MRTSHSPNISEIESSSSSHSTQPQGSVIRSCVTRHKTRCQTSASDKNHKSTQELANFKISSENRENALNHVMLQESICAFVLVVHPLEATKLKNNWMVARNTTTEKIGQRLQTQETHAKKK